MNGGKMKYKYIIYQPTYESGCLLMNSQYYKFNGGKESFDFDYWLKVYAGNIKVEDDMPVIDVLDKIFEKFNIDAPYDFRGHSLSIGDIVYIENLNNDYGIGEFYMCDSLGWYDLSKFKL